MSVNYKTYLRLFWSHLEWSEGKSVCVGTARDWSGCVTVDARLKSKCVLLPYMIEEDLSLLKMNVDWRKCTCHCKSRLWEGQQEGSQSEKEANGIHERGILIIFTFVTQKTYNLHIKKDNGRSFFLAVYAGVCVSSGMIHMTRKSRQLMCLFCLRRKETM